MLRALSHLQSCLNGSRKPFPTLRNQVFSLTLVVPRRRSMCKRRMAPLLLQEKVCLLFLLCSVLRRTYKHSLPTSATMTRKRCEQRSRRLSRKRLLSSTLTVFRHSQQRYLPSSRALGASSRTWSLVVSGSCSGRRPLPRESSCESFMAKVAYHTFSLVANGLEVFQLVLMVVLLVSWSVMSWCQCCGKQKHCNPSASYTPSHR
mmetsp:Transcript_91974/g.173269  ORF Transcript_91974/g.173269 Transcript_91974/m.173269 type:complete len:204 (+) Transcript_91974:233-844(+)